MNPWLIWLIGAGIVMLLIYPVYAGGKLKHRPTLNTALKGLGTFLAAGLAFDGALRTPDNASWIIALALVLCAIADVVLVYHFLAGMFVFLAGHLVYLCAFFMLSPPKPVSAILALMLFGLVALYYRRDLVGRGREVIPYGFYCAVISAMLSVAVMLPGQIGLRGAIAATGAALFFLSDFFLAKGLIVGSYKGKDYLVMGLYYGGQLVLALAAAQPWLG